MKAMENVLRGLYSSGSRDPKRILHSGLSLYGVQPSLPRRKGFKDADNSFKAHESCGDWDYSSQAWEQTVSLQ